MNETIVERQLSEVPSVFISATGPLGNKKAWAIYIALLQRDEGLRFNQIRELFEAEPPEIARALRALGNAGLITRQTRTLDDSGSTEASFYVPTSLGKALIAALYRGLQSPEHEGGSGPAQAHRPLPRPTKIRKIRNRTASPPERSDVRSRESGCACPPVRREGYRRVA